MNIGDREITDLASRRQLVSIFREPMDAGFGMQGFILDYSDRYLLLHYIHKFFVDGLLLIDRKYICDIVCDHAHKFQRQLLESEGVLSGIQFDEVHAISSLPEFLDSLPPEELVILEEEAIEEPTWNIGAFVDTTPENTVRIHGFSGAGVWDECLTVIDVRTVTCCKIRTNYIGLYSRYFSTQAKRVRPTAG